MVEPKKCKHTKIDGKQCGGNAMREHDYCYYHQRYHDLTELPTGHTTYNVPVFEDSRSILLAIHQTLRSYLSGSLEPKACGLALYGYQVASSIIPRSDARSPEDEEKYAAVERKSEKKVDPEKTPEFSLAQLILDTLAAYDRGEWGQDQEGGSKTP